MKKRLLSLLLAAGLLIGVALAVALGGSASAPLISLRYLEDTYRASLLQQVQEKATQFIISLMNCQTVKSPILL